MNTQSAFSYMKERISNIIPNLRPQKYNEITKTKTDNDNFKNNVPKVRKRKKVVEKKRK